MKSEIVGKVVAITGASGGIGQAIALMLARQGVRVVLGARRKDILEALVSQINKEGGQAACIVVDVKK